MCDKKPTDAKDMADRAEEYVAEIKSKLPEGYGCMVVVFRYDPDAWAGFCSSASRKDTIRLLVDFLRKLTCN